MSMITLTKSSYQDTPMVVLNYEFAEESFIEQVLKHPDFQVKGQHNIELVIYEAEQFGYPVEIVRQHDETGHIYNMRIGYIDRRPEELNL